MNVQRGIDGKLRPAEFPRVLGLPNPVLVCRRLPLPPPSEWGQLVHRSYIQITDIEATNFHAQRMETVR